jgi:hypothetical protein
MKTTVGGGWVAGCCVRSGSAASSKKQVAAANQRKTRADFRDGVDILRITSNLSERLPFYLGFIKTQPMK